MITPNDLLPPFDNLDTLSTSDIFLIGRFRSFKDIEGFVIFDALNTLDRFNK